MKRLFLGLVAIALAAVAQTSNYPASIDNDASLFVVADNVMTTLRQPVAIGDNVIIVASGTGLVANMLITICDVSTQIVQGVTQCTAWEHMRITAANGQSLTVNRGFAGTSARTHATGLVVSVFIDAAHQQSLKSAILALESWNMPAANIKAYGAVCDGTSDSSAAVSAALSAGARVIFIPYNCGFTAPGGIIQGGFGTPIKYIGENWLTSFIQPAPTGSTPLQAQAGVILENVSLRHTPNPTSGIDCPIGEYYNLASSTDPVVTTTCYSGWHAYLKDDIYPGVGVSGSNIRNHGIGDGLFVGQYDVGGVGIRSDLESGNGDAILVDINGGTGGAGMALVENVRADAVTPFTYFTSFRQSGYVTSWTQRGSTFSGIGLLMNFADVSGVFNGNFISLANGGNTQYSIGYNGQTTSATPTGSPPMVVASTTPVANLTGQVLAYRGGVQQTNSFMQSGNCTLGTNCAVALSPAYTSSASYQCTGTDQTAAAAVRVVNTSGSVVTFTGTGTDVVSFMCVGK